LDADRTDAKRKIKELRDSTYDLFGIPADHPMRKAELTPVRNSGEASHR
jgi:hypothetical protein